MSDDSEDGGDGGGNTSRRRLVRLLVALGFGVPLLVEGATVLGLVDEWVGGDATPTASPAPTATPTPAPVGEGDELLPETTQVDRLAAVELAETADGRELTLVVEVENGGDASYQLRLSRLVTADGDQVEGGAATDTLDPGESTTLTARWTLPAGAEPAGVEVVALVRPAGDSEVVRRVVRLADPGA